MRYGGGGSEGPAQEKEGEKAPAKREATQAEALQTLPGYKIDLLHTSDPGTEGSWIAMTMDNKGRLIVSGQRGQPILRFTLKDGKVASVDKLKLPISEAMGLLYAFDSLYVNGRAPVDMGCTAART